MKKCFFLQFCAAILVAILCLPFNSYGQDDFESDEGFLLLDEGEEFAEESDEVPETQLEEEPIEYIPPVSSEIEQVELNVEGDPPNLSYEAELHNIYLQFYSKSVPEEEWQYLVGERSNEKYKIQKGDSLWELSKAFFGDGNFWPKIWSLNNTIENPHIIEPENFIVFMLGNENEAPIFTMTETPPPEKLVESKPVVDPTPITSELEKEFEVDEGEFEEEFLTDEEIDDIVIPPPAIEIMPITVTYPPSLPKWKSIRQQVEDSLEVDLGFERDIKINKALPLTYFVDESFPNGIGKVVAIEKGNRIAADYQYVYVRLKRFKGEVGQRLQIITKQGPIRTTNGYIENAKIYEVQGMVELVEKLKATKKYRSKYYDVFRAKVISTLATITKGAEVYADSDYVYTDVVETGEVARGVSGIIIGGEFNQRRDIATLGGLVYLNRGLMDGLEEGQLLPIYSNHYVDDPDPYVITTDVPVGILKVAYSTDLYSTAYVVRALGMINTGDFFGAKEGFEKSFLDNPFESKTTREKVDPELEQLKKDLMSVRGKQKVERQEEFEFEGDDEVPANSDSESETDSSESVDDEGFLDAE